jgi:hypothetical protein
VDVRVDEARQNGAHWEVDALDAVGEGGAGGLDAGDLPTVDDDDRAVWPQLLAVEARDARMASMGDGVPHRRRGSRQS